MSRAACEKFVKPFSKQMGKSLAQSTSLLFRPRIRKLFLGNSSLEIGFKISALCFFSIFITISLGTDPKVHGIHECFVEGFGINLFTTVILNFEGLDLGVKSILQVFSRICRSEYETSHQTVSGWYTKRPSLWKRCGCLKYQDCYEY